MTDKDFEAERARQVENTLNEYLNLAYARISELEARNKVLSEALEFYACENNWHSECAPKDCGEYSCCHRERHTRAEAALKEKP